MLRQRDAKNEWRLRSHRTGLTCLRQKYGSLTHRCYILETGKDSYQFKASTEVAKKTGKEAKTMTAS
jgi:hypothetical protein